MRLLADLLIIELLERSLLGPSKLRKRTRQRKRLQRTRPPRMLLTRLLTRKS